MKSEDKVIDESIKANVREQYVRSGVAGDNVNLDGKGSKCIRNIYKY